MPMIYFDNAATTLKKPPEVARAVASAIDSFGGAGRGAHGAALDAGATVFSARNKISALLDGPGPKRVAFALNATAALNAVIDGLFGRGGHAVTTAASHNSVLRPLFRAEDEAGASVSVVPIARDGSLDLDEFEAAFRSDTRAAVVTHASNLTGDVYDIARMAEIAHAHGALLVVDAAQTAGLVPISMREQHLDVVCFTGHKSLFGPQGTGGVCLAEGVDVPAWAEGGTGTHSYDRRQPDFMPEHLEAGTLNAHGIAGLEAGVSYVLGKGVESIHGETLALANAFESALRDIAGVKVYGGHAGVGRTGVVAINIADCDSSLVADMLSVGFDICTRPGAHCAPLMHEALGTEAQGAVRFSFSHFNTLDEVDAGIAAVRQIARELA